MIMVFGRTREAIHATLSHVQQMRVVGYVMGMLLSPGGKDL